MQGQGHGQAGRGKVRDDDAWLTDSEGSQGTESDAPMESSGALSGSEGSPCVKQTGTAAACTHNNAHESPKARPARALRPRQGLRLTQVLAMHDEHAKLRKHESGSGSESGSEFTEPTTTPTTSATSSVPPAMAARTAKPPIITTVPAKDAAPAAHALAPTNATHFLTEPAGARLLGVSVNTPVPPVHVGAGEETGAAPHVPKITQETKRYDNLALCLHAMSARAVSARMCLITIYPCADDKLYCTDINLCMIPWYMARAQVHVCAWASFVCV